MNNIYKDLLQKAVQRISVLEAKVETLLQLHGKTKALSFDSSPVIPLDVEAEVEEGDSHNDYMGVAI